MYPFFYTKYGIRTAGHLMSPPLPMLDLLDLPKQSILHYVTASPLEQGPASDEFLFRNIKKPIMMGHITEVGDDKGMPRHIPMSVDSMIRKYHSKNRRFKIMRSLEASSRDQNTLVVYNYGFIPSMYRYMRSFYTEYYKWWNTEAAVWKNIEKVANENDRNQFIVCKLPRILPSVPDLLLGTKTVSQKTVKIFNSPESLFLLELWKWFGEHRETSLLNNLSEKNYDKVNLIFQESGRWFVMNLGRMNRWRTATKAELEANPEANKKGIEARQLQRRILRLLMTLFQVRTVGSADVTQVAEKTTEATDTGVVVKQDVGVPTIDKETGMVVTKTEISAIPEIAPPVVATKDDDTIHHDDEIEKQLEADLAELENISKNVIGDLDDEGEVVSKAPIVIEEQTLESGVMNVCNRLADNGMLSAAEYRRYEELAKSYRKIPAPDGNGTLADFMVIKPETLVIENPPMMPDRPTILDKSMLHSSLNEFDKKYIKEVLHKDVANMVMNVQNAGIAVTGYDVERTETIMGNFDEFTIKVKPVEGAASTLRFTLPAMEEDGSWRANSVRYKLRKQKGEVPIRKISPDSVTLTSYYGKTYVTRSDKAVNNYGQWLTNQIMAKGLDNEDQTVTNLHPSNVFDNQSNVPRLYSTLAMSFRGFTVTSVFDDKSVGNPTFVLSFDISKDKELYSEAALKTYEKDGFKILGTVLNKSDIYLVVDKNDSLYIGKDDALTDYCTIEDLIGLDAFKAPNEFAEVKVMGKDIPIGVVLGYEMGLSNLMNFLKVTPRRVPTGTRVNLDTHEYALVFSDETLVFLKEDKKAAMILAGFNAYHKVLRNYGVYDFDSRAVYLNLLEGSGITVRYLRELDLMYQMFIDPITRDLLIEMKEPTTFQGLLLRSCEMLLTDQHPDEIDPAYMRIKGYERMAGAVYTEMVRTIRAHNGKPGKSKQPLDLNPYAVWLAINQDTSKSQVNDINPIQNLKEMEAVTFSGTGGRGGRSMVKRTRVYHKNDMGTMSEATVDSGDVGINTFTSADPHFTSLRGLSKRFKKGETGPASMISTSMLISPGSDRDD